MNIPTLPIGTHFERQKRVRVRSFNRVRVRSFNLSDIPNNVLVDSNQDCPCNQRRTLILCNILTRFAIYTLGSVPYHDQIVGSLTQVLSDLE